MQILIDIAENRFNRLKEGKIQHGCIAEKMILKAVKEGVPIVTPQEPQSFKWCTDCKEYDQDKHCCHRYSKVIRDTVAEIEQEPILEKVNKMKSEIADSLEFWDYSPNNNPLARDILETVTNFWGDIREVVE
jgi:hypothetical protein